MTKNIDERIVQMQFDNKQFESGISTSLKSIDKLKTGLNMDGAVNSLNNLEKAGRSFSLAGIASGVDSLCQRFSTLGIVGITAIQNITNSALNAGVQLLKSLTVDPILTGLDEYETKMNAIQTILTNTASKGTTLQNVIDALNELNTYSDKTIYNFAEMARNIGTFTAAGVGLEDSVTAIKGIANLAAGSGSSALQASTAMYQLSQALAAGSVKLMDWNSVVNAGMGGELFQNALKASAKELGVFVDESIPFRETLEQGWLTAEVLINTLKKFAEDESLVKAATEVKTFTQLLDTMKESVQSGWAQSWEAIIGNKEQAAKFFTAINDGFGAIIGKSAEARNAMLSFWNANGGRDALIDALSNSFQGLVSILKPIGEAFREIFPAMTGERLIEITKSFRDLTSNFKIGAETSENLKNTFKGLFAILDIGRQILVAVIQGIGSFVGALLPVGDGVLGITGSIGKYLVAIDEMLKKTKAFEVVAIIVGDAFKFIGDAIKAFLNGVNEVFNSFSGLESSSEKVSASLEPVANIGDRIHNTFSKVANIFKNESSIFYKFATAVGDAFQRMAERITEAIQSISFERLVDVFNGAVLTAILLGIKKIIDSFRSFTSEGLGFFKGITETLDAVKGCLVAYQTQLKAKALLAIAVAIGILAASLYVLAGIDSDKIASSLAAITVMFGELIGAMALLQMSMGSLGFLKMTTVSVGMIALATAVLILANAMAKLGDLDWNGIAKGLVSVGVLCATLVGAAQLMSANAGVMIRGALGMILFTEAVSLLADVVIKLSVIDWDGLAKGLVGVSGLLIELALFAKFADVSKMGIINSVGIVILASAINILAAAVQKFAAIDVGGVVKGLTAMGVVLTELALFVNVTGNAKNVITTSIGLSILASAMLMLSHAIGNLGELSLADLAKGLVALGASLLMITMTMNMMPKNAFTGVLNSLAIIDMASAISILSKALIAMGNMSWDQVMRSLTALGASLAMIIATFALLKNSIVDATAMLIFTSSLFILAQALQALGALSLAQIGTSLLAIAGVFGILALAGMVLGPLIPVILALSGALVLLGVGIAAIGGGVFLLGTGLAAIAAAGTAAAVALVALVSAIAGILPMIAQQLAEAVIEFAKVIGEGAPAVVEAFVSMLSAFIDGIVEATPKILEGFLKLIKGILDSLVKYGPDILESLADLLVAFMKTIAEHSPDIVNTFLQILVAFLKNMVDYIPKITEAGIKILLGFLKGIADHIGDVVRTAIDVVINFIKGVASKIGDTIQAGIDLMVAFINGLADGIRRNTDTAIVAVKNLMSAIVYAAKQVLITSITDFTDIGGDIIEGLIRGIRNGLSRVTDAAENVAESAYNSAKRALGINSPSKVFNEIGQYATEGFALGLQKTSSVISSAKDLGNTAVDSLKDAISNVADTVSGDLDLAPTIRPILDLTDVEAGKKNLSGMFSDGLNVSGTTTRVASMSSESRAALDELIAVISDLLGKDDSTPGKGALSLEGLFKGAEFNVRSDSDIKRIAKEVSQEIFNAAQSVSRGRGLATI